MENGAPSDGKDPSGFLSEITGAPVTVKLNSGVVYKGRSCFLGAGELINWCYTSDFCLTSSQINR